MIVRHTTYTTPAGGEEDADADADASFSSLLLLIVAHNNK
jgi:hypothetical protein